MKKRVLFCLVAGLACGGFFTSCSDDDDPTNDEIVVCPVGQTTYTDASGLVLTYSGQPVLGKQVVFAPDANDFFLYWSDEQPGKCFGYFGCSGCDSGSDDHQSDG